MASSIPVKFTLTPQLHQEALVQLGRRSPWPTFFIVWLMITVLARWLLSLQIMSSCTMSAQLGAAAAFAAAVSGYFAYQTRKQMSKLEAMEFTFLFSELGVEKRTPHSESKMEWKAYRKFKETDAFFFLYYSDALADVVLKSAFASPEEAASFRELLAGRLSCDTQPAKSTFGFWLLVVLLSVAVMIVWASKRFPHRPRSDAPPRPVPTDSRSD